MPLSCDTSLLCTQPPPGPALNHSPRTWGQGVEDQCEQKTHGACCAVSCKILVSDPEVIGLPQMKLKQTTLVFKYGTNLSSAFDFYFHLVKQVRQNVCLCVYIEIVKVKGWITCLMDIGVLPSTTDHWTLYLSTCSQVKVQRNQVLPGSVWVVMQAHNP